MTRGAQALFVVAAAALWAASRMTWVEVTSSDGLGQPKTTAVSGATWSTALIPLALLVLAAAVAALAVHGWALRLLAVLIAAASAGMGYLAISLWVVKDVAKRAADLASIPVAQLTGAGTGTSRSYGGAVLTLAAAVCALVGAVLLMRSAKGAKRAAAGRYAAPAARRNAIKSDDSGEPLSERMLWDALDEGQDPTGDDSDPPQRDPRQ
ncbi:TIGR02234 family membrane protein [Mycobacterium sp. TNTM28]|uniref:TIGR02234 family membrane protein n=1 Tax=[Mycobacterium] fortunisiensis TaxID=2600579 RepID=A0ABS6KNF3_9MYCO|nr:TIGR02234 family membrane protein [[Mycobacterium] fortunisiensis]MBU9765038.1 TIGR02234 family membrane protein [[Mycobacterium] fortunisiensis]